MLLQLEIHNIAIIDKVCIELGDGLNILTGETGAGKSIIIDSINAILGERISKELIRTGKEKATVEAVFAVDNDRMSDIYESLGITPEEDGTLIISREISTSGKNTCRINGKMATVSMLKTVGQRLIDVHGQHDNQSLLRTESHIELLDSFGGDTIHTLKKDYQALLASYKELRHKLREVSGDKKERERRIDLLRFQRDDIKEAKLKVGEEEELNSQRVLLTSTEKIMETLSKAYEVLFSGGNIKGSASDCINEAVSAMGNITRLDEKFNQIAKKIEDISYQLDDVVDEIRRERDSVEYNPDLLERIEERIDLIYKLKRKYGNTVEEILDYCKKVEIELEEIENSEQIANELSSKLQSMGEELYILALKLHQQRVNASEILQTKIGQELDELEMKNACLKVDIEFDDASDENTDRKFTQNGLDKIEFLISTNAGEPLKPLSKIASGGEMSRVMLAIKTILANEDEVPTLIFDEIDIGISGKAAQKVGEKLCLISKNHQAICVTHLAQIACMADHHYMIEKMSHEGNTKTNVKKLEKSEVRNEIARILSGSNISNITLQHAEEMIKNAKKLKQ